MARLLPAAARALRGTLYCCLVGLTLAQPAGAQEPAADAAPAIEMQNPHLSFAEVDWGAAYAALAALAPSETEAPAVLARLNATTEKLLPNVAVSPVPVLLPFDTAASLKDDAQGTRSEAGRYLFAASAVSFFLAGPSGYDAVISFRPQDAAGLDLTFERRVDVQISASTLLYEIDAPALAQDNPVPELERDFPGIRRVLLEDRVRYPFKRFGAS